jgi:serine/threonine protein kinase
MLQSEIEILKSLDHERIVKYYGSQVLSDGK